VTVSGGGLLVTYATRCARSPENDKEILMTVDTSNQTSNLDMARVEEFAGRLFGHYTSGMLVYMIDLADRTGLFDALAAGAGTSDELARRADLQERYVRECLGALVTGGLVDYDAATRTYTLPPEHAVCLTGAGSANLAPFGRANTLLAKHVEGVERAFREGGGVPYDEFRPEFTNVMDGMSRGLFDEQLVDSIVPLAGELPALLQQGARVADVGCGTGHSTNVMAHAYPNSSFVGYDLGSDAIERARGEAAEWGLSNVSFEVLDVTRLPSDPPFEAIFAFDAIHDQKDPAAVLDRIHEALLPGGTFVMMDIKASSDLEVNRSNPFAPLLYAISTLHCMTVSLALDGDGLGTVWGQELATKMLSDAGFGDIEIHDVPDDPLDSVYVARKLSS
jgi:SAM-dependent methyltransferase